MAKMVTLYCIGAEWDEKIKLLKPVVASNYKKIIKAVFVILYWCLVPYMTCRVYTLNYLPSEFFNNQLPYLMTIVVSILHTLISTILWHKEKLVILLNQLLQFDSTITKCDIFTRNSKQHIKDLQTREMYILGIASVVISDYRFSFWSINYDNIWSTFNMDFHYIHLPHSNCNSDSTICTWLW